jgi:CrcB protein
VLPLLVIRWPDRRLRAFATVGLLGGYTTFSTFVVDVNLLAIVGHAASAVAYVVASLVAGPAAVVAGMALVRTART